MGPHPSQSYFFTSGKHERIENASPFKGVYSLFVHWISKGTLKNIYFQKMRAKLQVQEPWDNVIIFALNILIAIPIFIIFHQNLIRFNVYYNIDRVVLAILILVAIQLILRLFNNYFHLSKNKFSLLDEPRESSNENVNLLTSTKNKHQCLIVPI